MSMRFRDLGTREVAPFCETKAGNINRIASHFGIE